ncbi:Gfo/Idh/MocA family protein [Streptomyces sp. NPDC057101]|uniref:Gfo/Idh/MocA family protein n=1 Tax=Streptomyces sp. NPDC057101 TaxID=3346020 RepID=UPI003628A8A6
MLAIRRQSAEVRVGIVGTGFIGRIHARAARQAGARLVGVAGADLANATEGARALGAEKAFESATELISSGLIDVLHICTPHHLHAPIGLAAMDAGLAAICEKPLATEAPTAQLMTERAKDTGVTEDLATVQFATASGALGSVAVSQVAPGRKNRLFLEVSATAGSLAFDQENPEQLWLGGRSGSQAHVRDPLSLSKAGSPGSP